MRRPTDHELGPLSPTERTAFKIADFTTRRLSPLSSAWNQAFMGIMLYSCGGRRMRVRGLEEFANMDRQSSVLIVANHRSFFDFFTISAVLFWKTKLSKNILFPVRSTFFYDHPLGVVVNATMSGMRMFPPIMREADKIAFNKFSIERCIDAVHEPGTILGLHPEGTRNKGDDPYAILPAQGGVGRVILGAADVPIVPAFIYGISNSLGGEFKKNVVAPNDHPIDIWFGPKLDTADLVGKPMKPTPIRQAAGRARDAIVALAEAHRAEFGGGASTERSSRSDSDRPADSPPPP